MADTDMALLRLDIPKIKQMLSVVYSLIPEDPVEFNVWLNDGVDAHLVRGAKGCWTAGYKKLRVQYDETINLYIYHRRIADPKCSKAGAEVEARAKNTELRQMVLMAEVAMDSFTDKFFLLLEKGVIKGGQEA